MTLNEIHHRAEQIRGEFAANPDKPATFRDLATVFEAIAELARETSNQINALSRDLSNKTDPRLYAPSMRDR